VRPERATWVVVGLVLLGGCGSGSGKADAATPAGDGGDVPVQLDGDGGDAGTGEVADLGRESVSMGVYTCCAPGEGVACCAGTPQGTCFKYGGIYGDCRPHGALMEGKVICAHCCSGLARVSPDIVVDGECRSNAPVSIFICIRCGDGVCSPEENHCRCPADCPPPDGGSD
jgi:hypothetical protein